MDLNKYKTAFETMSYDAKRKFEIKLRKLHSTLIITESADIDTTSDFIAAIVESEDLSIISSILVQESVSDKFVTLLAAKVKTPGKKIAEVEELAGRGFRAIAGRIVFCPRNIVSNDESAIISYEKFRTTKEGIALAKNAVSVGLWCQNLSIAFEIINALSATQIWLNSSFGTINENIPFLSNGTETVGAKKQQADQAALIEIAGNIQFQSTFQNGKFKTIVIPFGETFAN